MIQTYLETRLSEGTRESAGAFTIDYERARLKMARFQLTDPTQYLLKFVQAAVLARSQKLALKLCRDRVVCEWHGCDLGSLDPGEVAGSLCRPLEEASHTALGGLAAGLNALQAAGPTRIVLRFQRWGESSVEVLSLGDRFARQSLPLEGGATRTSLTITVSRTRGRVDRERQTVLRGCRFCPIPIELNGERLEFGYRAPGDPFAWSVDLPDDFVLAEMRLPPRAGCRMPVPRASEGVRVHPCSNALVQDVAIGASTACSAWIQMRAALSSTARVTFVRAGVAVDTREVDLGVPGILAVLPADHLQTDLTGLQVLETPELTAMLGELRSAAARLRERLLRHLPHLGSTRPAASRASVPPCASCLGVLAGLGFIGFLVSSAIATGEDWRLALSFMAPLVTGGVASLVWLVEKDAGTPHSNPNEELRDHVRRRMTSRLDDLLDPRFSCPPQSSPFES
ncbi:MAG: hypothetical protein HY319_01550 [Armatimonadetes bacterium]|nr:hypothetical protein [Armatimonadota bacterium]